VFVSHIQRALEQFPVDVRKDVVLLFSAHSLPMSGTGGPGMVPL